MDCRAASRYARQPLFPLGGVLRLARASQETHALRLCARDHRTRLSDASAGPAQCGCTIGGFGEWHLGSGSRYALHGDDCYADKMLALT